MKLPRGFKLVGPDFYDFQYKAFLFCIERKTAGLLLDLGLGKTRTAIDVARYKMQFENVNKVLVVTPTSVMFNWAAELEKFSNDKYTVLSGPKEERLAKLRLNEPKFFIINYEYLFPMFVHLDIIQKKKEYPKAYNEALKTLNHLKYRGQLTTKKREVLERTLKANDNPKTLLLPSDDSAEKLKALGFNMLIFDESARYLKNHETDRTRASHAIGCFAEHKLILTATPIANKPMDLFAQFLVLDGGKTFWNNFFKFRNFFFANIGTARFKRYALRKDRVKIMHSRLYSSCIRFKKEEVLDNLPPTIYKVVPIQAPPAFMEQYKQMERSILSQIETEDRAGAIVNVNNLLTKLLRLQQLTGGYAYDLKTKKEKKVAFTPKLDALIEEVETIIDAEDSCIIWCRFHKTMELIKNALDNLKIKNITMSGKDSSKQKYAKWKGFQKSKDINVFIGQIESGGIGIELFKLDSAADKTQTMIFYENVWLLDVRQQAEGRIHRIGQKSTCYYIDLVVQGTIDERIIKRKNENQKIADYILDYGLQTFLKGE